MTAIPWTKTRSNGGTTLAIALTDAIYDYALAFGREPRLIQIPWWRGHEMPRETFTAHFSWTHRFRGVPFRFHVGDYIELS